MIKIEGFLIFDSSDPAAPELRWLVVLNGLSTHHARVAIVGAGIQMSIWRRIEDHAIYDGVAGEPDELSLVLVLGMLVHVDKQIVAGRIEALEGVIEVGPGFLGGRGPAVSLPQHNCLACAPRFGHDMGGYGQDYWNL